MKKMKISVIAMIVCIILLITSISKIVLPFKLFFYRFGNNIEDMIIYGITPILDVLATIALAFLCAALSLFFRKLEKGG